MKLPNTGPLPVKQDLTLVYVLSLVVAILMTVASVAGLVYASTLYPTDEILTSFAANDVVNILLGLPILLGSMWFAQRGKVLGLLFWPGALFYVFYNYVAYVFGMPLNATFPLCLILTSMSAYTTVALVANLDIHAIQQKFAGAVHEKLSGGALTVYGLLFLLLALGSIVQALTGQSTLHETELGVMVADTMIAPAWIIGGVLLWRREALGYVAGAALLFQASMLFIGLILVLLVQPLLTSIPLAVGDIIALCVMSLVCIIPLGLFVRGILRNA